MAEATPRWGALAAAGASLLALVLAIVAQSRLDEWALVGGPDTLYPDGPILYLGAGVLWLVAMFLDLVRVSQSGPAHASDATDWSTDVSGFAPIAAEAGPVMTPARWRRLTWGLALVALTAVVAPLLTGPAGGGLGLLAYPDVVVEEGAIYAGVEGGSNHLLPTGVLLWLIGTALVVAALAARPRWLDGRLADLAPVTTVRTVAAVAGVALVAAWFRLNKLAAIPPQMTSDHTEKLLDIDRVLGGQHPIFFWTNAGREPIQFYMTALMVRLGLPFSFVTLKLGMALVGVATIPLIYLLGRRVAGREAGFFAALFLALAPWHVQVARIGLRAAFSPFFVALAMILMFRAVDSGRRNDWLSAGAVTALGVYGYTGYRPMALVVPLVLCLRLGYMLVGGALTGMQLDLRERAAIVARHLAAAGVVGVLVLVPLLRYAVDRPGAFFHRSVTRMSAEGVPADTGPVSQFLDNLWSGLLMFNFTFDRAWLHSPIGRPALETVGGALLVLGVLTATARALRGDWRLAAMLLAIPLLLLSSVLALAFPVENPSLTRAAGALPLVAVIGVLPLVDLGRRLREALGDTGTLAFLLVAASAFALMARHTSARYFDEYRAVYANSTHDTAAMARVINGFLAMGGDRGHAYIVGWPHGPDYRAIGQQIGDLHWQQNLWDLETDGLQSAKVASVESHPADPARKLYVVGGPEATWNLDYLRELYPDAVVTHHPTEVDGKDFYSVFVPGEPAGVAAPQGAAP